MRLGNLPVNLNLLPSAETDVTRQYRYYLVDQDAPEIAIRFREEVERGIRQIMRTPKLGTPVRSAVPGLRRWPVAGFDKFSIYYFEKRGELRVLHVLHGSRNIGRILRQVSRSDYRD
jgi:plasmid stabilization system protein ParE